MSKSANDSFVFEVNKDTEWNKPYKPKANVGTDRVSGLIKSEQKQPEIKKERTQHAPPPNAPSIEQKRPAQTQAPVSGPIQVNVSGHEKIDYESHMSNIYKYRLRGPNKHLFVAYYTLFTKPVYEIYTKMKNKDPVQYTKEVSQAYNMDTQKCSSMFVSLNRWLYGSNSFVQKTESSILYRASEVLVRNAPQRQQNEFPYQQHQPQQPKDKYITELPATATSAINQTQEKQYPQMGRYPPPPYPMDYQDPGRYPQGRMYPEEYYDSRMGRDMYPPGFGMNYPMDYPPRYPPMGYYYDRRYDNYDPYGRYPEYDTRSPRTRDMGMDPRVDPRMAYDKYERMRERQPMDPKLQDKNANRQSTDDANRNNRLAMPDVRPPQLNEMQRDPRDMGREIPRETREMTRESIPRDMGRDNRDPRDIPREIPREMPRETRDIPRDMGRDNRDPRDMGRDLPREMPREGQRDMMGRQDPREMGRDIPREMPRDMMGRDPRMMDPRYDMRYDSRYMGRDMMRDPMYMNDVRFERDPFTRDMRGDMVRDPRDMRDGRMMDMRQMDRMGMDPERMQRGPMDKDPRGHMGERMFNVPVNGERDRNERPPNDDRKRNFVPPNQYK